MTALWTRTRTEVTKMSAFNQIVVCVLSFSLSLSCLFIALVAWLGRMFLGSKISFGSPEKSHVAAAALCGGVLQGWELDPLNFRTVWGYCVQKKKNENKNAASPAHPDKQKSKMRERWKAKQSRESLNNMPGGDWTPRAKQTTCYSSVFSHTTCSDIQCVLTHIPPPLKSLLRLRLLSLERDIFVSVLRSHNAFLPFTTISHSSGEQSSSYS